VAPKPGGGGRGAEQPPADLSRNRWPALLGLGLAAVLLVAGVSGIALSGGSSGTPHLAGRERATQVFNGIEQKGANLGKPSAAVSVGLFIDLQCGSCAEYGVRLLPPVVEELVRSGKARLVLHHFSLGSHPLTLAAIGAAAAGRQGREWQYAYLFMRNIDSVPSQGVSRRFLRSVARTVPDLDVEKWDRDLRNPAIKRQLQADDKLGTSLRLPAAPAVTVSSNRGSQKLTSSPTATRIERAVADLR
jgi:protein-disulfide isomerase